MTGHLALPALELLIRMSPLAAVQSVAFAWGTGELDRFCEYVESGSLTSFTVLALAGNGVLAFALNVSSFQTNKLAGALTVTVCGNIKQCLTILLGIILFNVEVGPLNGAGMALALAGAAWYSAVELRTKRRRVSASLPGSLSDLWNPPPTPATPFTPAPRRPVWESKDTIAAWLAKWRDGLA
jgi:Triose-phosphate Transporter family